MHYGGPPIYGYTLCCDRAEKLQLLNNRPTKAVEVQLLIEELDERFPDDKLTEILEIISELPHTATDDKAMET